MLPATSAQISALPLHVIELGPECNHVQNKVPTHRYLLALLVPVALISLCHRGSGDTDGKRGVHEQANKVPVQTLHLRGVQFYLSHLVGSAE